MGTRDIKTALIVSLKNGSSRWWQVKSMAIGFERDIGKTTEGKAPKRTGIRAGEVILP